MSSLDFVKAVLKSGIFIKLNYINGKNIKKYVYLLRGKYINQINCNQKLNEKHIYDICLNKKFAILDEIVIESVEYLAFPENCKIENIISTKDFSLDSNNKYMDQLKNKYFEILNIFNSEHEKYMLYFSEKNNQDAYDSLVLRFYPKKIKKTKNVIDKIKNDINDKFFNQESQDDYTDYDIAAFNPDIQNDYTLSNILAFKLFGISDKNINVNDDVFIKSLKNKWKFLIEKEKNEFLKNLENVDTSLFSKRDIEDFQKEILIFKKELDAIDFKDFKNLKTAKDVISYWPSVLQPKPYFVYED